MNETDKVLLFSDLATALARSAQMASAMKCDGTNTKYWYACIQLINKQGAMVIQASGNFSSKPGPTALSQLTPSEIAALQTYAQVQGLLPQNATTPMSSALSLTSTTPNVVVH